MAVEDFTDPQALRLARQFLELCGVSDTNGADGRPTVELAENIGTLGLNILGGSLKGI